MSSVLRVAQISFYMDPAGRSPRELLSAWPTLANVAECAALAGVAVSVIQASAHREQFLHNQVRYDFLPCARVDTDAKRRADFAKLLHELGPQVLHVQGLGFPHDIAALARLLPGVPIVLQDHADRLPRFWRRAALKRSFAVIAGVTFCARAQADPFIAAGVIRPATKVYEVPESTCRFAPGEREAARAQAGVSGEPLLLWVGHLNDNKDPMTVLAAVSAAARDLPGLQLWCCFVAAPLLREVQSRIDADPALRGRVHLLGRVPHDRIEMLMRAADIFISGSHREGSGYSLIEALACGAAPAVTDIPSFRTLTCNGQVGRLWPCGDAAALAAAIRDLAGEASSSSRARVRAHFERELSCAAVGAKLAALYRDITGAHSAAETRPGGTATVQ
jgi:glycosyltransferase involved in cell wall biosynthesis